MPSPGQRAHELLSASKRWVIQPGLTDAEFALLSRRLDIVFADDHRDFLARGVPEGAGWPNWRGDEMALRMHLGMPARDLLRVVGTEGYWRESWGAQPSEESVRVSVASRLVAHAPRLVPVFRRAFMAPDSRLVWSVHGGEIDYAGTDIADFIRRMLDGSGAPDTVDPDARYLKFWSALRLDEPSYPPLGAPPFDPDPPIPALRPVPPPVDPQAAYAELGIELTGLTRHDDLLAHHGPLWTVPARPGAATATQWLQLRGVYQQTGLWPVLMTATTWHRIGPDLGDPIGPELLGARLDGAAWLSTELQDRIEQDELELPRAVVEAEMYSMSWWNEFNGLAGLDHRFDTIALIPTPAPWYVPGLLQWSGAANSCIDGVGHAAVLRRWFSRWGVEPLAIEDETLILRVDDPPGSTAESLTAALEKYLYCVDSVLQDAGSIDTLANWARRRIWRLWWD